MLRKPHYQFLSRKERDAIDWATEKPPEGRGRAGQFGAEEVSSAAFGAVRGSSEVVDLKRENAPFRFVGVDSDQPSVVSAVDSHRRHDPLNLTSGQRPKDRLSRGKSGQSL